MSQAEPQPKQEKQEKDFAAQAEESSPSLLAEFWLFLKQNKKWWLVPILLVMLLVGVLIALGGTALAPFIYPLF